MDWALHIMFEQTHQSHQSAPGNSLPSTVCLPTSAIGQKAGDSYGAGCGHKHDVMLRRGGTTMSWG